MRTISKFPYSKFILALTFSQLSIAGTQFQTAMDLHIVEGEMFPLLVQDEHGCLVSGQSKLTNGNISLTKADGCGIKPTHTLFFNVSEQHVSIIGKYQLDIINQLISKSRNEGCAKDMLKLEEIKKDLISKPDTPVWFLPKGSIATTIK